MFLPCFVINSRGHVTTPDKEDGIKSFQVAVNVNFLSHPSVSNKKFVYERTCIDGRCFTEISTHVAENTEESTL